MHSNKGKVLVMDGCDGVQSRYQARTLPKTITGADRELSIFDLNVSLLFSISFKDLN